MKAADLEVIFVSLEPWDEIWRRNQFLCAELARRNPTARILFIAPARDVSNAIRRGNLRRLGGPLLEEIDGFGGRITVARGWKLFPNSFQAGRLINEAMLRANVRTAAERLGFHSPLLWINAHDAVHMVGNMGECAVIYDVTDDWTEFERETASAALTRQQDASLCARADAVVVCSRRLYELKQKQCSRVELIPNGVDARHYQTVLDKSGPLPAEASEWSGPVFGYTGTIHPERIDLELIESLARCLQQGSIVLVGPNHLRPQEISRLEALGNVFLPGPVPYARIPEMMRAFDVCIVPHRVTPFTESLNPIKLWEYLAAGKPIVSTNVAGFRDYDGEAVSIVATAAEFFQSMQSALHEPPQRGQERCALAQGHSWEVRVKAMEALIDECLSLAEEPLAYAHP